MSEPELDHHPSEFTTTVHGTVFAERADALSSLHVGDDVMLIPDPPGAEVPAVWVHMRGGDVVGHLPVQVAAWLAPWMLGGGRCRARVAKLGDESVPSFNRLVISVCRFR